MNTPLLNLYDVVTDSNNIVFCVLPQSAPYLKTYHNSNYTYETTSPTPFPPAVSHRNNIFKKRPQNA